MKKVLLVLCAFVITLAGCSTQDNSVAAGGSTSVASLFEAMIEEYVSENPAVEISYDSKGSGAAVEGINNDTYDIGLLSREIKDEEKSDTMTQETIAIDGIAVVTHPNNSVKEVSLEELAKIYTGEITNWSELGGSDKAISVISREDNSGTRSAFEELVGFGPDSDSGKPLVESAILSGSNGEVAQTVQGNEDAIGYLSFATLEENKNDLGAVMIDGVAPEVSDVLAGDYKLSRPFIMVYDESKLSETSMSFIDWVKENKNVLAEENGYIPVG